MFLIRGFKKGQEGVRAMAKVDRQQNPWRVLNSSNVYKNLWITVEHHGVLDPSGSEAFPPTSPADAAYQFLAFEDCKDPTGKARNVQKRPSSSTRPKPAAFSTMSGNIPT